MDELEMSRVESDASNPPFLLFGWSVLYFLSPMTGWPIAANCTRI
jgi:hypothetical protein